MVRIAVCDDDPEAADLHRQITAECLRQLECPGEISVYTDSKTLMWDITEDQFFFDLLLLDIEMPGITGMDLPEKIRPYLPEVKIIFITSHLEYAIDAYELSVFRYVPKDELEKRLPGAVRDAVKLIELEGDRTFPHVDLHQALRIFILEMDRLGADHFRTDQPCPLLLAEQTKWQVCYSCHRCQY